jgi:putative phage-type endonuclease
MDNFTKDFTPEARAKVIGGSDAGTILGVNPYMTPYQLFLEKRGLTEPRVESLPMRTGKALEELIANTYLEVVGNGHRLITPELIIHPNHDWMVAHCDRLVFVNKTDTTPSFGLECKSANPFQRFAWGDQWTDDIPTHYLVQVQHYLAVTGLPYFHVAVLFGNNDFRIYDVKRNETLIAVMLEREQEFIDRLKNDDPPPIDGSEAARKYLTGLYPKDTGTELEVAETDEIFPAIKELQQVISDLKKLEKQESLLKNRIMEFMGDTKKLRGAGFSISWSTSKDSTTTDWKKLAAENLEKAKLDSLIPGYTTTKPGPRPFRPTFIKEE